MESTSPSHLSVPDRPAPARASEPSATESEAPARGPAASGPEAPAIAELFRDHFDFIWRSLRRLGLDAGHADDAAQEVFLVASRKRGDIEPGRERAFLFGTALRVAADHRKSVTRRREVAGSEAGDTVDPVLSADALLDQRRARAALDDLLEELPQEVRAVFVLFELEELPMHEIAGLLGLQQGTVASRLRRGRALFAAAVKRMQARSMARGGVR